MTPLMRSGSLDIAQGFVDRGEVAKHCIAEESDPVARRLIVWTMLNRASAGQPARFGKTLAGVCLKRYQFSEDLPDAADNANLERVVDLAPDDPTALDGLAAYDEVTAAWQRGDADPTGGAMFFAAASVKPNWAYGTDGELLPGVSISARAGGTVFYVGVK